MRALRNSLLFATMLLALGGPKEALDKTHVYFATADGVIGRTLN
jgi:hypothetical protein